MIARWWWSVALVAWMCVGIAGSAFAQASGKTFMIFVSSTVGGESLGTVTFSADGSYLYSADNSQEGQYVETVDEITGASTLQGTVDDGDGYFAVFSAKTTPSTYAGDTPVTMLSGFGFGEAGDFFVFGGWSFDVTSTEETTEPAAESDSATDAATPTARERLQNRRR
jgi:VCBS repeat-containing protein